MFITSICRQARHFLPVVLAGALFADANWTERMHRANDLARERKPEAKTLYRVLIDESANPAQRAEGLNNLGALLHEEGAFGAAEPLYRDAIGSYQKANPVPRPGLAAAMANLAALLRVQARYDEAEVFYLQAIEEHDSALTRNNLAELYRTLLRFGEARAMALRAVESSEPQTAARAAALHTLAAVHQSEGATSEAAELNEQAFAIRLRVLGATHPHTASTLGNLMLLRLQNREYAKAEATGLEVLAKYEAALGPNHPHVAAALTNLAQVYHSQNRLAEAEPHYRRALTVWETAVGPDHPDTARGLKKLADFFVDQGKRKGAVLLYERALRITVKRFGGPDERALDIGRSLAAAYRAEGRHTEAVLLMRKLQPENSGPAPAVATRLQPR